VENVFGGDLTGSWRNEISILTKFYTQAVIFKFNGLLMYWLKCELNKFMPCRNPRAVGCFAKPGYFCR
jgi:hypothetical protein